jgi:hypothetical protein
MHDLASSLRAVALPETNPWRKWVAPAKTRESEDLAQSAFQQQEKYRKVRIEKGKAAK